MPPWLDEASELLTWLTIGSLVAAAFAVLVRWYTHWLREVIRQEIELRTELIQPGSNSGLSLPDVNKKLNLILRHLEIEGDDVH